MTETLTALSPESVQELQALVLVAGEKNYGLQPLLSDQSPDSHSIKSLPLDFSRLNKITSFDPQEAFITAEAGCSIKQLNAALQYSNWRLPFSFPESATLFDIFTQPWPGFRQIQTFPLTHWVTGLTVVTGDVKLLNYGGPVMKNVTGHDLCKLFVGSQSVFGLITSLTLRLVPKTRYQQAILLDFNSYPEAQQFVDEVLLKTANSMLETACLFRLKSLFSWKLLLDFAGTQPDIQATIETLLEQYQARKYSALPVEPQSPQQVLELLGKLHWPDMACQFSMPYTQAIRQPQLFQDLDTLDAWWNILANTFGVHLSGTLVENPNTLVFLKNQIESAEGIIHTHADLSTNYHTILDTASNAGADEVTKRWLRELKHQFDPKGVLPALRG